MSKNLYQSITVVIGLGRSGIGAAKLLRESNHKVIIIESQTGEALKEIAQELTLKGIEVRLGKPLEIKSIEDTINFINSVIISPGIPWNHPTLKALREHGIKVKGEIALAWENLSHLPWIGVTGTNGKTTVSTLIHHVLKTNNFIAPTAGNIGYAASEIALQCNNKGEAPDWLVMELSSFQIESAPEISPKIGIWTNLTPDHLDRHLTLDNYLEIKKSLIEKSEFKILNADDKIIWEHCQSFENAIWISAESPKFHNYKVRFWADELGFLFEDGKKLFHISSFKMPGKHNIQNLLMVIATARMIGITPKGIKKSLKTFKGVPHRLERIASLESLNIFNDSKATNYDASSIALKSLKAPIILIAGGKIKQGNASNWLKEINLYVSGVVLFGSSSQKLFDKIKSSGYKKSIVCFKDLEESVEFAVNLAFKMKAKSLILSPACASFDQYKNFEERGNHFKSLIMKALEDK